MTRVAPDYAIYDPDLEQHVPAWAYAWSLPKKDLLHPFDRCWLCDDVRHTTDVGLCDFCRGFLRGDTDQSC